jgi:calcineurin-like phosphoesterase family protein
MAVWFTADTHFNHKNIIEYCSRPYADIEEMNKVIIDNWNSVVSEKDNVVVAGDMFMGRVETIDQILPQLKGTIFLVPGNHDNQKRLKACAAKGVRVVNKGYLKFSGDGVSRPRIIVLHNPHDFKPRLEIIEKECALKEETVLYIYGHIHDEAPSGLVKESEHVYSFHAGVDTNDYTPVLWDDIYKEYRKMEGFID